MARGTLILVVGPSGAGKDSVLDGAKARLAGDSSVLFPARVVTRPAQAGGEAHVPATAEQFAALRAAGGFVLSWEAHGLSYGIPRTVADDLAAGRTVIVNVSRAVIDEARRTLAPVRVAVITASPETLARRLAARGRETEADIAERLRRATFAMPSGDDVTVIDNGGALDEAVERFVGLIKQVTAAPVH